MAEGFDGFPEVSGSLNAEIEPDLTASDLIRIDYIAPPIAISAYVTILYHFRCDEAEICDIQPASSTLTLEFEAQLAEAFFDQSHMIREINLFVGRTPARLKGPDTPFLSEMIAPPNLRELE